VGFTRHLRFFARTSLSTNVLLRFHRHQFALRVRWLRLVTAMNLCPCMVRCAWDRWGAEGTGATRDEYLRAALLGVCELPAAEEPVRECVVDELRSRSKVQLAHGAGSVHFGRLRHRRPRSSAFCPTKPGICGSHEIVLLSTKFQVQLGSA
jgi:hypothetical protein